MGIIISGQESIDSQQFTRLKKGKVYRNATIVLVDNTGLDGDVQVALALLDTGEATVIGRQHSPNGNVALIGFGNIRFDKSVLSAMVKAGIATQEEVDQHISDIEEAAAKRSRQVNIDSLKRACAELGIPVPDVPQ